MAERRDPSKTALSDSFTFSAPGEQPKKKKGHKRDYKPIGVYLSVEQEQALKAIAAKTGQSEYNILKYAIGYFLKLYDKDPGIIQVETKQVLKQP